MSIFELSTISGDIICSSASLWESQNQGEIILQKINNFDSELKFPFIFIRTNQTDSHYPAIGLNTKYVAQEGIIEERIIIKRYSRE